MRRFRYENLASCRTGDVVSLDKEESAHLFRTLRAEEGELCTLTDGNGRLATAVVCAGKSLRIQELETVPLPPAPLLHLYIAPPRRQKMDQILRQVTELGVWRIEGGFERIRSEWFIARINDYLHIVIGLSDYDSNGYLEFNLGKTESDAEISIRNVRIEVVEQGQKFHLDKQTTGTLARGCRLFACP